MRYRPLTHDDITRSPNWWEGRSLRHDEWRDHETRSAVAVDENDEIVAAGAVWTSRVHDTRFWLDVVVRPDRRRRGIGTALVTHLSGLRSRELPFAARGYVGDESLMFADALGATTTQVVPPARVEVGARTALRASTQTQAAATVDGILLEAAYLDMYRWTHEQWSPVREGSARAVSESLWSGLDPDASTVAVDDTGGVVALAMVFTDSDPALIVAETTARAQPAGERLLEGCVRRSLDCLARRGETRVDFDGHVSDPHLLPVLARLQPTGRWFRIVEIPAP